MKKIFALTSVICLIMCSLVGCGGKNASTPSEDLTLQWDGYTLSYNDVTLNVTEHRGSIVEIATDISSGGLAYTITIDQSKDVTNLTLNTQGILEENMEKLKEMFYYQEYLGSKTTAAISLGSEYWIVGQALTNNVSTPAVMIAEYLHSYLTTIPVTDKVLYVDCGGKFTFGSQWYEITARPSKCLIKDVIQVVPGQIHPDMTAHTFNAADGSTRSGMYAETEAFQYYYYEGFTIQCAHGINIYDYVTFK